MSSASPRVRNGSRGKRPMLGKPTYLPAPVVAMPEPAPSGVLDLMVELETVAGMLEKEIGALAERLEPLLIVTAKEQGDQDGSKPTKLVDRMSRVYTRLFRQSQLSGLRDELRL